LIIIIIILIIFIIIIIIIIFIIFITIIIIIIIIIKNCIELFLCRFLDIFKIKMFPRRRFLNTRNCFTFFMYY
jgi:hypothetical protein